MEKWNSRWLIALGLTLFCMGAIAQDKAFKDHPLSGRIEIEEFQLYDDIVERDELESYLLEGELNKDPIEDPFEPPPERAAKSPLPKLDPNSTLSSEQAFLENTRARLAKTKKASPVVSKSVPMITFILFVLGLVGSLFGYLIWDRRKKASLIRRL